MSGTDTPRLETTDRLPANAIGIAAFSSATGPLLGYWIERGLLFADAAVGRVLAPHLDHGRKRARRLRAALDGILDALAERGVRCTLLKGSHTAHDYFPEPGTRPATDIDILVSPADLPAATSSLRAIGMTERLTSRTLHRSEWVSPDAPPAVASLTLTHADNPWSLDLHSSLSRRYFRGLVAGLGYPGETHTAPWSGRPGAANVLQQPMLTAALAIHASAHFGNIQLLKLVELALVVQRDTNAGALDFPSLGELLRRTSTERFAYPALALTERLAPHTVDPALLRSLNSRGTPRMRRALAELSPAGAQAFGTPTLDAKLLWARGPVQTLLNLSELLLPVGWTSHPVRTLGALGRRLARVVSGRVRLRRS